MKAGAPRVGIIGGGWAGMAAAVTLANQGVAPTLFESAKALGGRARTVDLEACSVDNGQHILLGAYHETLDLIARVNPLASTHLQRRSLALTMPPDFSLRAPSLPAPWHLLAALMTARGLRLTDRLSALRLLLSLRLSRFRLTQDETVSALLNRHRQTPNLQRYLWRPLCLAALNTAPEQASAQVFLNVLRDSFSHARADSDLVLPGANLSQLFPEPAAAFVRSRGGAVHLGTRVQILARHEQGWALHTADETQCFDHVICATPPLRAAELLSTLPDTEQLVRTINTLRHEPIFTVYLQYPDDVRLSFPMLGLDTGHGQWVFDRGQLGGPPGLLAVVISAHGPHEALGHDELARTVADQLQAALGLAVMPAWHQVIAEKRATFACTPAVDRPPACTPLPHLYLAGDYVAGDYPATIEGAVRSGVQCARLILESP